MARTYIRLRSSALRRLSLAAGFGILVGAFFAAKWGFASSIASNADEIEVTEFAVGSSPGDPNVRYLYARRLERQFDMSSTNRSLVEYEAAVARSPHNFIYWLGLGQARERDGDRAGAERAYRYALGLAPNYARARWALGNNLIRQGRIEEGLEFVAAAVDQDASFAAPAVTAALIAFDGDFGRAVAAFGEKTEVMGEIVKYLVGQGHLDDAIGVWNRLPSDAKSGSQASASRSLSQKLIEAKRFRSAAGISAKLASNGAAPMAGSLANGGFEEGVSLQNAGPFDWQIAEGIYPQVALFGGQPKEGRYSLAVLFNSPARLDWREVRRTVAVEPGATYDLTFSARSELNTKAEFKWEVTDAASGVRLGISQPLAGGGWADQRISFTVPAESDGIVIKLVRENCSPPGCTISGNIFFDDFRLARSNG